MWTQHDPANCNRESIFKKLSATVVTVLAPHYPHNYTEYIIILKLLSL
jgi:hypothetical protein